MKKILCILISSVLLLTLFSCGGAKEKTYDEAVEDFKTAGYYVITDSKAADLPDFGGYTGVKTLIALQKDGMDQSYCNDWDGEGLLRCKNFVYAFYFDDDDVAMSSYNGLREVMNQINSMVSAAASDGAPGAVSKNAIIEKEGTVIYIGTQTAIDIAIK